MVAGPVVALGLVLGPLAGAPEAVITGAIALAFSLAWALVAVGSIGWTEQPQLWALVPASALAAAGRACLARPNGIPSGVVQLVVPIAMLGLASWMAGQARASLRSRSRRWVLYPVFGVMALASVAAIVETVRETYDRSHYRMDGELVDVGGHRVHLVCSGAGAPTVLLMSGAGETSAVWAWIAPAVRRDTRVCAFDRAGRAWSDPAPSAQDGVALAADLHTALHRAGIEGPFVLVGHSFGGLYARVYARRYPAEVAGMVLLDATHPGMFTRIASYPAVYEGYRRVSGLFPTLARLGVGRIAYRSSFDNLPIPVRGEALAWWSTPALARSQRDEWAEAPVAMRPAGELASIGARPLVVVTAVRDAQSGWMALQEEMLRLSSLSVHRVAANATHMGLVDTEAGAAVSIEAIRQALAMAGAGRAIAAAGGRH
jgi:Predicted hydrolases or acyltransferases (alpha/beta hydrolase superfamily)